MTFAAIEASGLESWLAACARKLILEDVPPDPVRRVIIWDGSERPLGVNDADE